MEVRAEFMGPQGCEVPRDAEEQEDLPATPAGAVTETVRAVSWEGAA